MINQFQKDVDILSYHIFFFNSEKEKVEIMI